MTNSFLTEPLNIGGQLDAPRAINTAEGFGYATERVAEGVMGSVKGYVNDIVNPALSALRDVDQGIFGIIFKSERGDNSRLKNLGLGLSGAAVNLSKMVSNSVTGLLGATDKLYRNGVVDAHSEFSSGTIDRLWEPGMGFGNIRRIGAYIGGIIPRAGNMLAKGVDAPLDYLQKITRPAGREAYQADLRFR